MEQEPNVDSTNIGYWEQVLQAPTPAYAELFEAERKYLLENIPPGARVLDIGCGDGRNMRTILKNTQNVVGLDNDKKALGDAKENFKDIPSVELAQATASGLPFEKESFDVVTVLMILPNLSQSKTNSIKEAARVLKQDGVLLLSTFAETAFGERMKIYSQVGAHIEKIEGMKVVFNEEEGFVSEQHSKEELEQLGREAGLMMIDCQKVGVLAYICKFKK